MTKQYKKYHNQLDDVLQALMKTCGRYEPIKVIQGNLKEIIPTEQLELLLSYLQSRLLCSRSSKEIAPCKYGESIYQIMFEGFLFLEEGGFRKIIKDHIHNTIWTVAKTISAIISSVAIIIIGYFQFQAADRANADRDTVKAQLSTINSVHKQLDSLKSVVHKKDSVINLILTDTTRNH